VKIIFPILFILIFNLFSFSQNETNPNGYNKFYYENGKISSEGYMKNGKPNGYWKTYYINGKLQAEGNRKFFLLDSTWVFYDIDGDTLKKINYFEDKKNGYFYTYQYEKIDSNKIGGLLSKELYYNNLKEGTSCYYDIKTGKIDQIINYKNGAKEGFAKQIKADTLIITIYEYRKDFLINKENINRYNKNEEKQGVWKEFHQNNNIKTEMNYLNGKLNGYYKTFDENKKLLSIQLYKNGELTQEDTSETPKIEEKTEYYSSGKPKTNGQYLNGLPINLHKEYSPDGKVIDAKFYDETGNVVSMGQVDEKDRKIGHWKYLYPTGELKSEGDFNENSKTGKWKFYYISGSLEQEGSFTKGKYNGIWKWYYETGELLREENFLQGKEEGKFVEYTITGEIVTKGEYINGKKNGEWEYTTGDAKELGSYEMDEQNGIWKYYNLKGKLIFEGEFVQGIAEGKHLFYYDTGRTKEERNYVAGNLNKYLKQFDEEGNVFLIEKYKNGTLIKINGSKIELPSEQ
jgi:antitoxin component YwqK of YwqJK toxin-antitoxin module